MPCKCKKPIDNLKWKEHMTTETPVCLICNKTIEPKEPPKEE